MAAPALLIPGNVIEFEADRCDMAECLLKLDGRDYCLDDAPFYQEILARNHRRMVMCTGRQVFKSTIGAVNILLDSALRPHFKTLYITPSAKQTKLFSKSRHQKMHDHSPDLKEFAKIDNPSVWEKYWSNGSENYFSYAGDRPDRIRGYSTDSNKFDEMQDIVYDTVVPVANETFSMSKWKQEYYAGTHKTLEGPLAWLDSISTQNRWVICCEGCNRFNVLDSTRHIGLTGPICAACGKRLNPRLGFWHEFNPQPDIEVRNQLHGYHVSQLMLPKNSEDPNEWSDLLRKYREYDEVRFLNEVLGVATASGFRFIERGDLLKQCRPYSMHVPPTPNMLADIRRSDVDGQLEIYAGIDWSGGGYSGQSRTVLWIFGVLPDFTLKTLYFEIFQKNEAFRDLNKILNVLKMFKVRMAGADAGVGAHANSFLREKYGSQRVLQFQYGHFKMHYTQGVDRVFVDKTAAIDSFFNDVKRQRIYYPHQRLCKDPFDDMMAVYSEITQGGAGRKIWQRSPGTPDDALHAQVFAWLMANVSLGRVKLYSAPQDHAV